VTGGGKTAIYVEAIAASLEAGRPALVLVPEISMAMPLVDRLRSDLDVRVALVHSGLGEGERADEWRRIRAGDVDIVVGTRLAVVAPLADVGVLIVDEVWDSGTTIHAVTERVRQAGGIPTTVVLHYKPERSNVPGEPDLYAVTTDRWVVYPFKAGG